LSPRNISNLSEDTNLLWQSVHFKAWFLVFATSDVGPFWMSADESELNRKDHLTTETIKRFRNKSNLLKDLQAKGVSATGMKDELQVLCKNKDIPIVEQLDEVVEGCEQKPKGMLQILWERGFIDPAKKKEFYVKYIRKQKKIGVKQSMFS
jgi:hypothetical protein